jgi:hypothetical protein
MVSREENEKGTEKMKAWCPKCYMAFENGPTSQIVQTHKLRKVCDTYACNKPNSNCVRRFRSINASNRHVYCYSDQQVREWNQSLQIPPDPTVNEDFGFNKLALDEETEIDFLAGDKSRTTEDYVHYPIQDNEGPPYQLPEYANLTQIFDKVGDILGPEFSKPTLKKIKIAYKKMGYTSAYVFRLARENQGSWEFLYRDFTTVCPEIVGTSHVLKYILSQKKEVKRNP